MPASIWGRSWGYEATKDGAQSYAEAEARTARVMELLVGPRGFARLPAKHAENAAALTRVATDGTDLVLHNLRMAGRRDVVRLGRQLVRTERQA